MSNISSTHFDATLAARGNPQPRPHAFRRTRQMMRGTISSNVQGEAKHFDILGSMPTKRRRHSIDVTERPGLQVNTQYAEEKQDRISSCPARELDEPVMPQSRHSLLPDFPHRYKQLAAKIPIPYDDKVYYRLGDASISNNSLHYMLDFYGDEAWMRDESLSMALEALWEKYEMHKIHMGFMDSNSAQLMYMLGEQHGAEDAAKDSLYDFCREKYHDKKYIFVVLNDGFADGVGTHWSLLILNRVRRKAHLIDSLYVKEPSQHRIASAVSHGLLRVLGENWDGWEHIVEWNSPNQIAHNRFEGDIGACGPFVFEIISLWRYYIDACVARGLEDEITFEIVGGWGEQIFKPFFDSFDTRWNMQKIIVDSKSQFDMEDARSKYQNWLLDEEEIELVSPPINASTKLESVQNQPHRQHQRSDSTTSTQSLGKRTHEMVITDEHAPGNDAESLPPRTPF